MSDEHDYYSDQCSGCKWAEWRGGCLNKATAEDGSDLDAADRGQCDHFEAGDPQKRPPQPGDRMHVQMPLDDYTALRTRALAATARAEAAEQRAEAAEAEVARLRADGFTAGINAAADALAWRAEAFAGFGHYGYAHEMREARKAVLEVLTEDAAAGEQD